MSNREMKLYERSLHSSRIIDGIIGMESKSRQLSQYCKLCYSGNKIEPFIESLRLNNSDGGLMRTTMNCDLEWKSTREICNRESSKEDKIINHIKLAHYKKCFSCDNCGDFFVSSRSHHEQKC